MSKRIKFFLSHLFISLIIALLVIGLVFFVWYPLPLAKAVGVTHIFLLVLTIDVIIGPFLGLLVYKESKKTLKFDLSVIILIQICALVYGVYSIAQGRPVWLAYNIDRFELIRKNEIIPNNLKQAKPAFQHVSWFKPQYVAVDFAKNAQQRNDDMFNEVLGGISIAQKPERYVAFTQAKEQILKRAQRLKNLADFNQKDEVTKILQKYPQATAYLPMKASAIDMTVLIDAKGQVVKIVDLRPWD